MERLDELKMKLAEVDRLIGDILDSEPESEHFCIHVKLNISKTSNHTDIINIDSDECC